MRRERHLACATNCSGEAMAKKRHSSQALAGAQFGARANEGKRPSAPQNPRGIPRGRSAESSFPSRMTTRQSGVYKKTQGFNARQSGRYIRTQCLEPRQHGLYKRTQSLEAWKVCRRSKDLAFLIEKHFHRSMDEADRDAAGRK